MTEAVLLHLLVNADQPSWKVKGRAVTVKLPDGRSQTVTLSLTSDSIQLESAVTSSDVFDSPMNVAMFLTEQHEGLISTHLRIIGGLIVAAKELPFAGLSGSELTSAIQELAVEADRIEWLVTGRDVH